MKGYGWRGRRKKRQDDEELIKGEEERVERGGKERERVKEESR